jgi:hypothetical protein
LFLGSSFLRHDSYLSEVLASLVELID